MPRPAAIALLAACAACASADPLAPITPDNLGNGAQVVSRGSKTRFIGFEQSEGYATGPLAPQNGWREFPSSAGVGSSIVGVGRDGGQSLFLTDNPGVPNGLFIGGLSPTLDDPGARGAFTIDTRIDDLAGASYTVIGQSLELNGINFRLIFEFGRCSSRRDAPGPAIVDTNVFFDLGAGREVRVEWQPGETRYFYDGRLIYTSTSERFAGESIRSSSPPTAGRTRIPGGLWADRGLLRQYPADIPAGWSAAPLGLACVACVRRRRYPDADARAAAGG